MTFREGPAAAAGLRDRLVRLPKTELHLHALGALRPATILDLARRRGAPILAAAERGAAEGYRFGHLSEFVAFFLGLFELVRSPEDFERVTYEVLSDAHALGVRYAELRWTPTSHVSRGASEDGMFRGIASGTAAAAAEHGVLARHVVDFPRSLPLAVAERALEIALRHRQDGVVALDIAGDERAVAADPCFGPLFARARAAGLGATAHAGEGAGPASVRDALDLYGARRIGHGTRAVEDPALLVRLAREGVVLEVCPTSNEALGVVPSVACHPLPAFLDAGIRCALSSDDPTLFRTDVAREYERLHREARIPLRALAAMAATGFEAAFVPPEEVETRERLVGFRAEAIAWGEAFEAEGSPGGENPIP